MNIQVVVPLYNEEKYISDLLKEIRKSGMEIVVVDDGSTDSSKLKVQSLKMEGVTLLSHEINLGKGAAMKTGAEYAFESGADAIIFMDSDAQHNPMDLTKFVEVLQEKKCGVVFGSRNLNMGVPMVRYLGNKFASVLVGFFFGIYVSDLLCGFRGVTRDAYEKIKWESSGYGVETEMVIRTGKAKVGHCEVPIETIYLSGVKGVTILDAFGILLQVVKWRLTI